MSKLTEQEKKDIRFFFIKVFNNNVIYDELTIFESKINKIKDKSFFKKIIDCVDDAKNIAKIEQERKEYLNKNPIVKPCLVLDSCGLIKAKFFSSTDSDKKINSQDTILIQYDNFDIWLNDNEKALNAFLDNHSNIDLMQCELIALFFEKNIENMLT